MVYITSHLFDADPRYHAPAHPQIWNTMVDTQPTSGLGKRKRRTDSVDEGSKSTAHGSQQRSPPVSKGLLRLHGYGPVMDTSPTRMYPVPVPASAHTNTERRPAKQIRKLNPKVSLLKSTSHLMDIEPDPAPSANTINNSDLRPCHSCKTAPKRKRDLENYMECKRCDERACYICARECVGCQKAICKKCIVEVGKEGDPWCLECYSMRLNS